MSLVVDSKDIERCLRKLLKVKGYIFNEPKASGETGVDILAKKGKEKLYIEVISFKSSGPARSKDFFQAFFRAISRLDEGATYCIIALPERFENGLPARVKKYRTAWKRIAESFPELEIWLVDLQNESYKRTKWGDWLGSIKAKRVVPTNITI